MKKQFLCLMALAIGFSACQKDQGAKNSVTTNVVNSKFGPKTNQVINSSSYVDLALIPRNPGENFDTYHCLWLGTDIYVTGLFWDSATYPNLYTGVPLYGTVSPKIGTYVNVHDASGNGVEGTTFALVLPTLCGLPTTQLQPDIDKYTTALDKYTFQGAPPFMEDYVASDYGTANCPQVTYQLKLIRCTTGSGYGVATANYPATLKATTTIPISAQLFYTDPLNSTIGYVLTGVHGKIQNGYVQTIDSQGNQVPGTTTTNITATGNYYITPTPGTFQIIGSVTRIDGSVIPFNFTEDPF